MATTGNAVMTLVVRFACLLAERGRGLSRLGQQRQRAAWPATYWDKLGQWAEGDGLAVTHTPDGGNSPGSKVEGRKQQQAATQRRTLIMTQMQNHFSNDASDHTTQPLLSYIAQLLAASHSKPRSLAAGR
ncbi:hypothetical protein PWT90_03936 [Aphanocladium album]|nr:hypothetical protein PWT90_03936 [Aphanocladium album]